MRKHRIAVIAAVAAGLAAACTPAALSAAAPPVDYSQVQIKITALTPDFHTLEGQGGTISALSGPDGVLLVDSQFAPLTEKLVAAIRTFSDQPVRFLVNTHVHGDHTGGNENFANLGAVIFSREQLRARLEKPNPAPDGTPGRPAPPQALPVVTYDNLVRIHANGEDVELIPIRVAHTDGDTLIRFPKHDILAVGDYIRTLGYPRVDRTSGGTLAGLLAAFDQTIALAGPNTKIIPGHGVMTDRAGVQAQKALVLKLRDRVAPMLASGRSVEEIIAAKPTADTDASIPQGEQTSEQFVRWMVAELQAGR